MAPRKPTPAPPPAAPPADPPAGPETPAETPAEFSWELLKPAVPMPLKQSTPGTIKVNVLESVHEHIRERAESSLTINTARVAAKSTSSASRARVNYHWDVQEVPDTVWGQKFGKALEKYAKYRPAEGDIPHMGDGVAKGQVTVRHGDPTWFITPEDGPPEPVSEGTEGAYLGVRYSVRPLEQRSQANRLPGTAG